ncbi:MAG: hypothetical protein GY866_28450, partial [Proteobacteria bacterium]|nr:hypothetical protein [Pseudomonadota bacterium]
LMLSWMKEKDVSGLILRKSRFGQSLFGEIPWEIWWREISLVENHFLNSKPKGFTQAKFRNQCRRLELAAVRLGFRLPQEMNVLNYSGVRNRFGTTIANVWKWSYGREANAEATLCQTGFPWKEHRFREPPFVKRHLEYPLVLWERIAPLLDEDLDKLCGSLGASGERVTRLDWHVTLDDLSEFHIPIRFRNPHDMRREKGNHLAALLQANYSFTTAARERFPAESDDDYSVPPIVGWEIVLSATLVIPDILYDIFGEIAEKESDIEVLLRLENELPVRLNRFTPQKEWLPEDSYSEKGFGPGEEEMVSSEIERSLDAVAEDRPLYIRNQPLPLQDLKPPTTERFLESTMDKWWKEKDPGHIERNYFKHIDSRGNATWVFQDSNGRWYQHGIFG